MPFPGRVGHAVSIDVDSPAPRTERLARRLAVMLFICLVLLVAAIAVIIAQGAARQAADASTAARNTSNCVNNVLAQRAAPTANDAEAHIRFAVALSNLVTATKPQQPAAFVRFVAAAKSYVHTLQADQAYRDAHPLGRC